MNFLNYIVLTITFTKEDNKWVAFCKELSTSTYADTLEEAQKEIGELIELHLNTLEDVGERERFFKEHKIVMVSEPVENEINIAASTNPNVFTQAYVHNLRQDNIVQHSCY